MARSLTQITWSINILDVILMFKYSLSNICYLIIMIWCVLHVNILSDFKEKKVLQEQNVAIINKDSKSS